MYIIFSREETMFGGFTDDTVQFLLDLKFHNSADFFHSNHDRYIQTVQKPFYELIEELAPAMSEIDPLMEIRPYKCISRIHRDTRFSRDKSPYRDHHWFLFRRAGEPREKSLNYFFEFGPERLNWGLGVWGENRELFDLFRRRMSAHPEAFSSLIDGMMLPENNLVMSGTWFKRLPVPSSVPERLKVWYCIREVYICRGNPVYSTAFTPDILAEVRKDFITLSPLYRLLRGYQDEILTK